MKYFAIWWYKSDGKNYAQLLDSRPDDAYETDKKDFYKEEINLDDMEEAARAIRSLVKETFDKSDLPEDFTPFIRELQNGGEINISDYFGV
ncbi:MAG: hypothetical protein FWG83_00505 [Oscillospiraceae bacterium]|nr:hypothetical protein [Oscillospiraceae bacterium]